MYLRPREMTGFRLLSCYPSGGLPNTYSPQSIFNPGRFMPCSGYGYTPRYVSCSPSISYSPPCGYGYCPEGLGTVINEPCGYSYLSSRNTNFQRPGKYNGLFSYGRGCYEPQGYGYLSSSSYGPYGYNCAPSYNHGCCYSSKPWGYSIYIGHRSCYEPQGSYGRGGYEPYGSPYGRGGYEPYGYSCAPSYTCGPQYSSTTRGYGISNYGGSSRKPRGYGYFSSNGRNSYESVSPRSEYPYRRHSSSQLEPGNGDYYPSSSRETDYRRRNSRSSSNDDHS